MWAFRLNCVPYYPEAEGRGRNDKFLKNPISKSKEI